MYQSIFKTLSHFFSKENQSTDVHNYAVGIKGDCRYNAMV